MMGLDAAFHASGAAAWGGVAYTVLLPYMEDTAQARAQSLCPEAAWVWVAAFPYFAGERPGNLSLYARGEDYHQVLLRRLTPVCAYLSSLYPKNIFLPGADTSPLPEREAAWQAGLGLRGENGLFILPPYGSYVFLGTILTDKRMTLPAPQKAGHCLGCGLCRQICPAGALSVEGLDPLRCLSHLSQKKGRLDPEETTLLAQQNCAWGCDLCQKSCPHNAEAMWTTLPEFREALVDSLTLEVLEGLSNRTFGEMYGEKAFSWRGPAVLRRNLSLQTAYHTEKSTTRPLLP